MQTSIYFLRATNIKLMLKGLSGMAEIDDQIGRGLDEFIRSEPREKVVGSFNIFLQRNANYRSM
jgi:hypothetical protein